MTYWTNVKDWPVQVSVSFPKEAHRLIAKEAKRLNMSKSEYIRQCVYASFAREGSAHDNG